eukprot:5530789-Prymnesium_polylepis.2
MVSVFYFVVCRLTTASWMCYWSRRGPLRRTLRASRRAHVSGTCRETSLATWAVRTATLVKQTAATQGKRRRGACGSSDRPPSAQYHPSMVVAKQRTARSWQQRKAELEAVAVAVASMRMMLL